jgi:hypothetical protein
VVTLTKPERALVEHAIGAARSGTPRTGITLCRGCGDHVAVMSHPDGHGGAALGAYCFPCGREIRVMIDAPDAPSAAP